MLALSRLISSWPINILWTRLDQLLSREPVTDSTPAMTVRDVAAYLNVNEKTVYRLAPRRELPGFKVAGVWRFQRHDIDHWIQRQKSQPEQGAATRR
jgi:excisionase family DNA binding protein